MKGGLPRNIEYPTEPEPSLPILEHKNQIKEAISSNPTVLIVGETGSGKTTQIPLMLRDILPSDAKIAITQPRRIAAISVAKYVAERVGCRIGEEVGYQTRFENCTSERTRINFMTDGILLRKIQQDPLLREYSAVMVDEAHERSLNIDFILGLLKRLQRQRIETGLPPLKIIISSATLEKEKLARFFGNAPVIEIPGRLYPVEIHYEKERVYDYPKAAAEKVKMIVEQGKEGDILIFMPGREEIDATIKELQRLNIPDIEILPLHGDMAPEEQQRIFKPSSKRRVIVATNIAETSVTVPGIRHVIDSGLIKQIEFNPSTGIEALVVRPHAESGCTQRAGRAGRIAPGECWRLYTESDFENRPKFQKPEIQRSNIAHVVLMMKGIGIEDVRNFEFLDPPSQEAIEHAIETLKALGALDEEEKITETGELMAELPLEPRISRMVIEARRHNCVDAVCVIASFLGVRTVFVRPEDEKERAEADNAHRRFHISGSDFLTLLKVWQEYVTNHYSDEWAEKNFLNKRFLKEIKQIYFQLLEILSNNKIPISESQDPEAIGKSITAGLIENLMELDHRYFYRRVKDDQRGFLIHPSSVLFRMNPQFIVTARILETKKEDGTSKLYMHTNQAVRPEWIPEVAPHLVRREIDRTFYDPFSDKVLRRVYTYLKGSSSPFLEEVEALSGEEAVKVFAEVLAEGKLDFPFVKHNGQVIEAVNDLWLRAEGNLSLLIDVKPPLSIDFLRSFYAQRLGTISSKRELNEALERGEINLELNIDEIVSREERERILKNNPDSIDILGKSRPIKYRFERGKFIAAVEIPAADVLKLEKPPVLPSGRVLVIEVIPKEEDHWVQFSGTDLEDLKRRSRSFLIKRQWEAARFRGEIRRIELENFDPADELPILPEPIQFGLDPESGEPLFAYPAIIQEKLWTGEIKYYIEYFPSQEEAEQAQGRFLEIVKKAKEEKEKRQLSEEAGRLLAETERNFDPIRYNYSDYGLTYEERNRIRDGIDEARRLLNSKPQEAIDILREINQRLAQAFDYKKQKDLAKEKAEAAIRQYYSKCPLCGKDLEDYECRNFEHDIKMVDFEIDENGYEIGPAIISRITTDQGKIIAEMRVSYGEGRERYRRYPGEVYVVFGHELGENGWRGEPFESLKFENFGRILTPEQAQERLKRLEKIRREKEITEARKLYQEKLEEAEQKVKEGIWGKGKFKKGKHPQSGKDQWELVVKRGGLTVIYVVDYRSRQPSSEDEEYFYSEVKALANYPNKRVVLVKLEEPFPEDKPEEV